MGPTLKDTIVLYFGKVNDTTNYMLEKWTKNFWSLKKWILQRRFNWGCPIHVQITSKNSDIGVLYGDHYVQMKMNYKIENVGEFHGGPSGPG